MAEISFTPTHTILEAYSFTNFLEFLAQFELNSNQRILYPKPRDSQTY